MAGVELCVFDAYGTLFDPNSSVARHRLPIGPKAGFLADMWLGKQIQYTWLRSGINAYALFWKVSGDALDHCPKAPTISEPSAQEKLMSAYPALYTFTDAPAMLQRLGRAELRAAILSNGNPEMLDVKAHASGLALHFEAFIRIDAARVSKVDRRAYEMVEARSGVTPDKVCLRSSNCRDAHGAARFGLRTVRINRARASDDDLPSHLAAQLKDLVGLPDLLGI